MINNLIKIPRWKRISIFIIIYFKSLFYEHPSFLDIYIFSPHFEILSRFWRNFVVVPRYFAIKAKIFNESDLEWAIKSTFDILLLVNGEKSGKLISSAQCS